MEDGYDQVEDDRVEMELTMSSWFVNSAEEGEES